MNGGGARRTKPFRRSSWEERPAPCSPAMAIGPTIETEQAKVDGGALVGRVLRGAGRALSLRDQRRPHLADPRRAARARRQADPHAPRAVVRLCRRRLCAHHRHARRVQRDRRLRADQRRHRPLRRRASPAARSSASPASIRPPRTALGSFQEAYGSEICRSFSKFTKRVLDWSAIEVDLRQAFREAMAPPQGVAAGRDPDQHPLPAGRAASAAPRRARSTTPASSARQGDPRSDRARDRDPARRRAAADRRRRRRLLVEARRRSCARSPS